MEMMLLRMLKCQARHPSVRMLKCQARHPSVDPNARMPEPTPNEPSKDLTPSSITLPLPLKSQL